MITQGTLEMCEELRSILGAITGAEKVQESFSLEYVIVCKDEAAKSNVEQVAKMLIEQAEKQNISLDIVAATEDEIADARKRLMSQVA